MKQFNYCVVIHGYVEAHDDHEAREKVHEVYPEADMVKLLGKNI